MTSNGTAEFDQCPECGFRPMERIYGGERGEAGPFFFCALCGFDEEHTGKQSVGHKQMNKTVIATETISKMHDVLNGAELLIDTMRRENSSVSM